MNRAQSTSRVSSRPVFPSGFTYRGLLFAVPVVLAVPLIAWFGLPKFSLSSEDGGVIMHTVARGPFVHDVTEHGSVESANNVEIRCEVESHGAGTMIIWIIPEGTYVEPAPDWEPKEPGEDPPDLLVKLDSSSLEDELLRQQITCNSSEAAVTSAQNNYETALIAKEEYLEGRYEQEKLRIESKIFVAKEELRKAEDTLKFNKEQLALGYVSELQVQAYEFRVEKAKKDLLEAETDLKVLEEYTKKKTLGELESNIKVAQARLKSEEHSHQIDMQKLEEIQEQIAKCTIRAPQAGQVVYANITDRRGGQEVIIEEGTKVRERQEIIRLPDSKNMQVKAKINEARVSLVREGMPASIELDAFPDRKLTGTVEKVNEYPLPTGWWVGNVKEYETIIKINDFPEDLQMRPGMTAKVSIRVETLEDVLQVPVQAVFEHGGKHYCVLRHGEGFEAREVVLGSTNDKEVVIEKGLSEGEQVVLGAALYRDDLDLPELPSEDKTAMTFAGGVPAQTQTKQPVAAPQRPAGKVAAGAGAAQARGGFDPGRIFKARDADGNGRLEGDEIHEQMKANLAALDTNGDGAIDRSEFTTAMGQFMRMRGGRRPGGRPGAKTPAVPGGNPPGRPKRAQAGQGARP